MAELLDGARVAARMKMELADRVARLRAQGRYVGLGTILVGDDGPSATYVALKHADCHEMGIESIGVHLPADASQDEIIAAVEEMNDNPLVHAFLVQLPLPDGVDTEQVLQRIRPDKDVDGLHPVNLGKLALWNFSPLIASRWKASTSSSLAVASRWVARSPSCWRVSGQGATRRSRWCTRA